MTELALSRLHFPVTTLGPGRRVGIWFQGCSIRCPGCVSMDTWAPGRGLTTVDALLRDFLPHLNEADGLTVSGGEPFEQPDALADLLRGWRAVHRGDVLVYSGRPLEMVLRDISKFDGLIDAVMADPYLVGAPQTLALRGSDNQRLVMLTELGRERFAAFERSLKPDDQVLDVMFDDDFGRVFLAGIPRKGDIVRLERLMGELGHEFRTTMDGRA